MSPPPDRPAGSAPRPPSKGPPPKGPQNPASGPHRPPATPSLGGKRPAGPAPKGPAAAGSPPKAPAAGPPPKGPPQKGGTGRPAAGRPPVQAPAPKAFEIRRGRADKEGGVDVSEDDRPLGPVVLPRSITQEAEEESLKGRFGVEKLPEVAQRNTLVTVADSAGQSGPERTAGGKLRLVLVLVVVVAVVAVALKAMKIIP